MNVFSVYTVNRKDEETNMINKINKNKNRSKNKSGNRKKKYFFMGFAVLLSLIVSASARMAGASQNIPYLDMVSTLRDHYGIVLSNEQLYWNDGKTRILARALDSIGYVSMGKTRFLIENRRYKCGIDVYFDKGVKYVSLSVDVFKYPSKRVSYRRDGRKALFSKKLEKALLCLLTDFGENKKRVDAFLQNRFSIYLGTRNHLSLTGEKATAYKSFTPRERMILLHTLMDLSLLMKGRPSWTLYLLRRENTFKDSHLFHSSTARSHILSRHKGYIEFTDEAFTGPISHSKTIFIHEIMHFFVENIWRRETLKEWANLGSWYRDRYDMDQWSTKEERAFVSPYAFEMNPTEDLVESLAHYVVFPSYFKFIAPHKYRFVQNNLMKKVQYLNKAPSSLSFLIDGPEQLDLFPERIKELKVISSSSYLGEMVLGLHLQPEIGREHCESAYVMLKMYNQNRIPLYVRFLSNKNRSCYLITRFKLPKPAHPKDPKEKEWILDSMQVYNHLGEVRFQSGNDFYFKILSASKRGKVSSLGLPPSSGVVSGQPSGLSSGQPVDLSLNPSSSSAQNKRNERKAQGGTEKGEYAFHYNDRLYPVQLLMGTVNLQFSPLGPNNSKLNDSRLRLEFQVKEQGFSESELKRVQLYFSGPRGTRYRFVLSPLLVDEEGALKTYRVHVFFPQEIRGGIWNLQEMLLHTKKGLILPYHFVDPLLF